MMNFIGWLSSTILLVTICRQIYKQWRDGTSEGVSKYLFVGQVAASTGFLVYSWSLKSWVFVVTNGLMIINAFVGLGLTMAQRDKEGSQGKDAKSRCDGTTFAPLEGGGAK